MEQYNVILNKFPANPRSKRRLASQGFFGSESSSGGSNIGGSSFSGYWDLITTNAAGEALDEGKEYIRTKYSAVSEKDVVAYGTQDEFPDMGFPIATYSTPGAVQIKQGGGLIIGEDGIISVDPIFRRRWLGRKATQRISGQVSLSDSIQLVVWLPIKQHKPYYHGIR